MNDRHWQTLLSVLGGECLDPLPVGLIIDSPWLPNWAGGTILEYLTSDRFWIEANLQAVERFPDVIFLPGFWSEYGMCTEPSAWGAKCVWPEDDFPHVEKVLHDDADVNRLKKPDCRTDGLCPFVIKRLEHGRREMERHGHLIRFAVSRGPHNIASYLLGHSEFLLGVKINPEEIHALLRVVTDFVVDWLRYQKATFPSIDGMLVLDDLIGFVGERDFADFVLPYFTEVARALDVSVKALHNDAHGLITAKHIRTMGFNLFNFSFEHSLAEIRRLAGDSVILFGNIPPRDVLARGGPEDVARSTVESLSPVADRRWIILSGGGGTPPGVPSENIDALVSAAAKA